jgi:hypothetical protein
LPLDKGRHAGEATVEAAERGEDEGVIKDNLPEVTKGIDHPFKTPTIVRDGEITQNEVAELNVDNQCARLVVADKLCASRDLDELRGDRAIKPRADCAVHLAPMRISGDDGVDVREDMVGELVLAEGVEEESLPPVVVRWKIVEVDGDHRLDVENGDDLSMKSGDCDVGLGGDVCSEDVIVVVRRRGWRHNSGLARWWGGS